MSIMPFIRGIESLTKLDPRMDADLFRSVDEKAVIYAESRIRRSEAVATIEEKLRLYLNE